MSHICSVSIFSFNDAVLELIEVEDTENYPHPPILGEGPPALNLDSELSAIGEEYIVCGPSQCALCVSHTCS